METELDKIKSTITISLGLKNRLREAKGGASYEAYIAQLFRVRNEQAHSGNYIEIQKIERKEKVYSFEEYKVVFSYNKHNQSPNFTFDLQIKNIRNKGRNIMEIHFGNQQLKEEYELYFNLLSLAIQNEIEPNFKHKGRFEDSGAWKREFEQLGLPKTAFEDDVLEKLNEYENGVHFK